MRRPGLPVADGLLRGSGSDEGDPHGAVRALVEALGKWVLLVAGEHALETVELDASRPLAETSGPSRRTNVSALSHGRPVATMLLAASSDWGENATFRQVVDVGVPPVTSNVPTVQAVHA